MKLFKNYKFRASEIGKLMVGTARKADEISKTTLSYLKEIAIKIETKREKIIETPDMIKGIELESEAIELISNFYQYTYSKNEHVFTNDYIIGIPDIVIAADGQIIVRDIKVSRDIFTFPYYEKEIPNSDYYWQLQSYLWLCDAEKAYLDYVLLNTPEWQIQKMLRSKYYELLDRGLVDDLESEHAVFEINLRFNLTYDDLPVERKIKTFEILRNDEDIEKIKSQIEKIWDLDF